VSLVLLLGAILALFLLRVPMAFAILGPCLAYLIVEGYSLGLAVRLVVEGINSWPLLAVPLFIPVGIVPRGPRSPPDCTTPRCCWAPSARDSPTSTSASASASRG
jgi:hypothetical protein